MAGPRRSSAAAATTPPLKMNTDDPTQPAITGRTHASSVEHNEEHTVFLVPLMRSVFFDSIDHNIYIHD